MLAMVAVAALLMAVLAASAQAAPGYKQSAEFGNGSFPGLSGIYSPGPRVAVDDVTGDVLAAYVGGNGELPGVFLFGADGTPIGQVGSGSTDPGGIAIDQTNGDLYVADTASGRIVRYTSDRANPPTYTLDASYNGPSQGSNYSSGQIGSLLSSLAVDPTNGDLLVADSKGLRIDRYAPDGAFLGSFDGEGTEAGKFTSLIDLAVAPNGQIDVVQDGTVELESGVFFAGPIAGSLVARYGPGGSEGTLLKAGPVLSEARAIAVDPTTGRVVVATGGGAKGSGQRTPTPLALTVFASSGVVESIARYVEPGSSNSVTGGVAIAASTGTLYSPTAENFTTGTTSSVREFTPVEVPGASVAPPTNLTPFAGQAQGVVTPVREPTSYYFEYKSARASGWSSTPAAQLSAGEKPEPVSAELSLESATEYSIRLVAEDAESENVSPILIFSSPAAAPVVVTGPAVEVEVENAHVEGTVNPLGSQATYWFEYGPTTAYGSITPAVPGVVGNGRSPTNVGVDITNLNRGTTYHYRLVATGPGGSNLGEDRTFQTQSASSPGRAFELVSPLNKGNVGVNRFHETALASLDGNAMFFGSGEASYPGAESTPNHPRVSAVRTATGWQSRLTDPPEFNEIAGGSSSLAYGTLAISGDQSKALVATRAALTPGAVAGESNLYVRNLTTNQFTFVATGSTGPGGGGGDTVIGIGGEYAVYGISSDMSTIVFAGGVDVTGPGYQQPQALAAENEYEWNELTGLRLVNVMPDGTPSTGSVDSANVFLKDPNRVSTDGKRIYFSVKYFESQAGLYLREDGKTIPVSASQRPGEEGVMAAAELIRASADGRYVVFKTVPNASGTVPVPLTPDAPEGQEGANSIYQYDAVTGKLRFLASNAVAYDTVPETGMLYYSTSNNGSTAKIMLEHNGVQTLIGEGSGSPRIIETGISSDGRYFAFLSVNKLTEYENNAVRELYLYDATTGSLTCPSCRTDGKAPTGPVGAGFTSSENEQSGVQRHVPRFVLDNGTVFFDTPDPLVPRDVNGERDVYEYRDGQAALISDGSQAGESEFADATPDGSNVFITTNQQLVPQDRDRLFDLYDARVGGGFPADESGAQGCGTQCGAGAGVPAASTNGTEAVAGSSKAPVPKKKHPPARCTKKTAKKKSKRASRSAKCRTAGKAGHGHRKGAKGKKHAKKGAGR